jgi:hypothetical protein
MASLTCLACRSRILRFSYARHNEFATSRQLTCGCNSLGAIGRERRRRRSNAALHCARNSARRGSKRVQRYLAAGRHTLRNGYRPWSLTRPDRLRADFGNPSRAAPCAPAGLRTVIERCLEQEAGHRYQRASEVRTALEAVEKLRRWHDRRIDERAVPGRCFARRLALGFPQKLLPFSSSNPSCGTSLRHRAYL